MGEVLVTGVASEDVSALMPLFREKLEEAMERGGDIETLEHVQAKCEEGTKQLWAVLIDGEPIAVGVTAINEHSNAKVLEMQLLAGSRIHEWRPFMQLVLESFARDNGCTSTAIFGRKGWDRLFPDYRQTQVVLRKVL